MDADFRDLKSLHKARHGDETSRETLVERIRLQRSQREQERQQIKGAIRIQSAYRCGFLTTAPLVPCPSSEVDRHV